MRFSDRVGKTKPNDVIQENSMTIELRNLLWNVYYDNFYPKNIEDYVLLEFTSIYRFAQELYVYFFKNTLDNIPENYIDFKREIRGFYFRKEWYEVYNFLEFTITMCDNMKIDKKNYIDILNRYLKQELSAYRIVGEKFVPITNDEEITSIEKSLTLSNDYGLNNVITHISASLDFLANKQLKDSDKYRNSIKESISTVEALCNNLNGKKFNGLDDAISTLNKKIPIHGALIKGFKSLYGYTSQEDGVRHPIMDEPNLDIEDAVYMLVSCSAFLNYLIQKAEKAGLFKDEESTQTIEVEK